MSRLRNHKSVQQLQEQRETVRIRIRSTSLSLEEGIRQAISQSLQLKRNHEVKEKQVVSILTTARNDKKVRDYFTSSMNAKQTFLPGLIHECRRIQRDIFHYDLLDTGHGLRETQFERMSIWIELFEGLMQIIHIHPRMITTYNNYPLDKTLGLIEKVLMDMTHVRFPILVEEVIEPSDYQMDQSSQLTARTNTAASSHHSLHSASTLPPSQYTSHITNDTLPSNASSVRIPMGSAAGGRR